MMSILQAFNYCLLVTLTIHKSQACFNDAKYRYKNDQKRSCKFIRKKELRRQKFCTIVEVNESCPQTCGSCCVDNPDYEFKLLFDKKQKRGCQWLSKPERRDKYCKSWNNGSMIRNECVFSCNVCQPGILPVLPDPPTPSPSLEPTDAPSTNPTNEPTPKPSNFPTSDPTSAPTSAPTSSPTSAPTRSPTRPPTQSPSIRPTAEPSPNPTRSPTKSPTDAPIKIIAPSDCSNDPEYNLFGNSAMNCKWIGQDEFRRNAYCQNEETRQACPQICGLCCEDKGGYEFTTNTGLTKTCEWLNRLARREKYCGDTIDGVLVSDACPIGCGECFDSYLLFRRQY
mmetsp:Transcript_5628/g.8345  ORF Transcript_5628/g.8345 Transcript_5628/m.8345 type:complete len:339 (-) Transcript_5628:147-1163(-)